jgi:hypothetical protein
VFFSFEITPPLHTDTRPRRGYIVLVEPHVAPAYQYVQIQSLVDDLAPKGTKAYMKAGYLRELDDHAIETAARFHREATSPASEIHFHQFGGAVARVGEGETAYGEREAPFVLNILALTHEPGPIDPHVKWVREFYGAIEPSLTGGAYINFLSAEGAARVEAAYGAERFTRLRDLKSPIGCAPRVPPMIWSSRAAAASRLPQMR